MNNSNFNPITIFFYNFALIIRNRTKAPQAVVLKNLWEYLCLKIVHLFVFICKIKITRYSISGFSFKFFDFYHFVSGFEHRFIQHDYFFSSHLKSPAIIDCGANIGDSVLYFKKLFPDSEILAFEADPNTFEVFQENIKNNHLTKITPVNKAVFDKETEIDFYFNPDDPGVGSMSLFKERLSKAHIKIPTVLLSSFIEKKVDFLKIDIEGAEINVLEDLNSHNKLHLIDQIIIEYHHNIPGKKSEFLRILEILEKSGFHCQFSTEFKPPFVADIFQDILIYAYRK